MFHPHGNGAGHGKVILFGEHAVVYNHEAIALPVFPLSVEAVAKISKQIEFESNLYRGPFFQAPIAFKKLILEVMRALKLKNLKIIVDSKIPQGAGLGSSAAVAGAIVQAIYHYLDEPLSLEQRLKWIGFSEAIVHGNPSGIDAYLTSTDKPVLFAKGKEPKALVIPLPASLVIGYSGIQGSTLNAINTVARFIQENGKETIDQLGKITSLALPLLQSGNAQDVGKLMNQSHQLLKRLGVCHPKVNAMVELALTSGAYGTKMTGGGMGGCAIALMPSEKAPTLVSAWEKAGFSSSWTLKLS